MPARRRPNALTMTQQELLQLRPAERAAWLDECSITHSWADGDTVFCLHCDGEFQAAQVHCDQEGDPTCPLCHAATPLDFAPTPWWR